MKIIVLPSDKGNIFTVSGVESFEGQGDLHTSQDIRVTQQDLMNTHRRMNALTRGLNKVTILGSNGGDSNLIRCWNNGITDACVAPLLYPSPKTHKPVGPQGDPKSRPVVQASSCVTSRPGELLADILNAALNSYPTQHECLST